MERGKPLTQLSPTPNGQTADPKPLAGREGGEEERIRKNNRLSIITKDNIGYGADDQVKSESLLVIGRIEFQDLT